MKYSKVSICGPLSPSKSFDNAIRSYYIRHMTPSFEWDDLKNEQNKEKHGVSFFDAQYALADPHRVIIEDLDHSANEDRFFCFGKVKGGIMAVRFTERRGRIRIIGGRVLEKREEDI
ncbi:MAG: BrnT family toxin [Desulfobacteraceae bacterium]|nr:BrnT family toxin [Desulfobacteraceae bacterium]